MERSKNHLIIGKQQANKHHSNSWSHFLFDQHYLYYPFHFLEAKSQENVSLWWSERKRKFKKLKMMTGKLNFSFLFHSTRFLTRYWNTFSLLFSFHSSVHCTFYFQYCTGSWPFSSSSCLCPCCLSSWLYLILDLKR